MNFARGRSQPTRRPNAIQRHGRPQSADLSKQSFAVPMSECTAVAFGRKRDAPSLADPLPDGADRWIEFLPPHGGRIQPTT
jgi:hypothetical protein